MIRKPQHQSRWSRMVGEGATVVAALLVVSAIAACSSESEPSITKPAVRVPPFEGTIFIDPDIITASDPTTFQDISYTGQGSRLMFDRRIDAFVTLEPFLFDATYDDGFTVEVQVNPEFGTPAAALVHAEKYAEVIGRLPTALRRDVETMWIHMGTQPFGGGNRNLLIHIGQAALYERDGILEETFIHEASHTSLDAAHATSTGWIAAQQADGVFISNYARDNPYREDIAESFVPYMAVRYRRDRISNALADAIVGAIPNRIQYFDDLHLDVHPIR